jgi:hypothetical protein
MRITEAIMVSWSIVSCFEGCVDPYLPDIDDNQQSIIIDGILTDKEGYHYVHVSRSVSYESHENMPVQGCVVEVLDDEENAIQFYESEPGLYEQWINQEYLKTGKKYKLRVTVAGTVYESQYETMFPCPPVGNVYYEIEKRGTADPENDIYGIQFYTDLVVSTGYSKNYRWELEESWEYHAEYLIRWWKDSRYDFVHDRGYSTDSLFFCWSIKPIHEIYIVTAKHITGDILSRIPLRYVSNETNRLKIKYSLLIKQYSLSDKAYNYWNQLKKQNEETGGLYETQPEKIRGNISNINDDNEIVLGFFNVSGLSEERIFVSEHFHFFPPDYNCILVSVDEAGPPPIYYVQVFEKEKDKDKWDTAFKTAKDECFVCTLLGGTTQKPDFWD